MRGIAYINTFIYVILRGYIFISNTTAVSKSQFKIKKSGRTRSRLCLIYIVHIGSKKNCYNYSLPGVF